MKSEEFISFRVPRGRKKLYQDACAHLGINLSEEIRRHLESIYYKAAKNGMAVAD